MALDVEALLENFARESDRGVVLVCHAQLDRLLEEVLQRRFASYGTNPKAIDFLLTRRPHPPLQSFYVKATLSYALGLISNPCYEALIKLNELRNTLGHSGSVARLSNKQIESIISVLEDESRGIISEYKDEVRSTLRKEHRGLRKMTHLRANLLTLVLGLFGCLYAALLDIPEYARL